MQTTIHLSFNGQCAAAFEFYKKHLGASIGHMLSFGKSPMADQVPAEWQDKIINGEITLNGVRIAGGDLLPEQYVRPAGFTLLLSIESEEETKSLFEKLSVEGTIFMPIQKTFFSSSYGIVTDKFGITWKLSCTS